MNEDALKEVIRRKLPGWLPTDPEFRAFVLDLTRSEYAYRLIVIPPMIDAKAQRVAEELGIEIYGDSTDIETL